MIDKCLVNVEVILVIVQEPVTISTLGSCVVRDIFRICDKKNLFNKIRNVGFISPLTMFTKLSDFSDELKVEIENCNAAGFEKRGILLDSQGDAFQYLISEPAEYLIFDITDIRLMRMKKGESSVTLRRFRPQSEILKNDLIKKGYQLVSPESITVEEVISCCDILCKKIKEAWPLDKVIFLEDYPVRMCRSKDGTVDKSSSFDAIYKRFDYQSIFRIASYYIKENLNCNYVMMPELQYVLADAKHTWGRAPLHYSDKIYEYFYDKICSIVFKDKYESKQEKLLKEIRDEYYACIFQQSMNKQRMSKEELDLLSVDTLKEYCRAISNLRDAVVLIIINNPVGAYFDEKIQKEFYGLGMGKKIQSIEKKYIALLKDGVVLFESDSKEEYNSNIDFNNFEVLINNNFNFVNINGNKLLLSKTGINMVVFSLKIKKIIDFIVFDPNKKSIEGTRKDVGLSDDELIEVDINKLSNKLDLLIEKKIGKM